MVQIIYLLWGFCIAPAAGQMHLKNTQWESDHLANSYSSLQNEFPLMALIGRAAMLGVFIFPQL